MRVRGMAFGVFFIAIGLTLGYVALAGGLPNLPGIEADGPRLAFLDCGPVQVLHNGGPKIWGDAVWVIDGGAVDRREPPEGPVKEGDRVTLAADGGRLLEVRDPDPVTSLGLPCD